MRKLTYIVTGLVALASSAALAGTVQPQKVIADEVNNTASGDQVTARYSDNKVEYIGCGIRKISDGAGGFLHFGFCQARDRDEVEVRCFSQDAELLDTISSSADYGFITFSWNDPEEKDGSAECTRIGFSNQSFYLPTGLGSNE